MEVSQAPRGRCWPACVAATAGLSLTLPHESCMALCVNTLLASEYDDQLKHWGHSTNAATLAVTPRCFLRRGLWLTRVCVAMCMCTCRRRPAMAMLTGVSVLAGVAPVLFLINADIQQTGLPAALAMSALAGALASVAGEGGGCCRAHLVSLHPAHLLHYSHPKPELTLWSRVHWVLVHLLFLIWTCPQPACHCTLL